MSKDLTIVRAQPQDAQVLADMYAADMRDLGNECTAEDLLPLVDATLSGQPRQMHTWVAKTPDGDIAGAVLANPFWSLKVAGQALWIEELYVRPEYRRRGIGRMLVEHLLDWAEDSGLLGVELEAYRMNTGASILYRDLDFLRLARERYCYYFSDNPRE